MEHLTLKAATTVTDTELGEFEAIVSAWEADRENDSIAPTAFDNTIAAWRESGKNLPLLFEHGQEVVGYIDPETMRTAADGLVAEGNIDRESERGPQAWRMIKSGVAGFSIGYMAKERPRADGGRELVEIDLLEISITSKPMNAATRALSWKSAAASDQRERASRLGVEELAAKANRPPVQVARFDVE
jgi:HK97 family phage prohead protease